MLGEELDTSLMLMDAAIIDHDSMKSGHRGNVDLGMDREDTKVDRGRMGPSVGLGGGRIDVGQVDDRGDDVIKQVKVVSGYVGDHFLGHGGGKVGPSVSKVVRDDGSVVLVPSRVGSILDAGSDGHPGVGVPKASRDLVNTTIMDAGVLDCLARHEVPDVDTVVYLRRLCDKPDKGHAIAAADIIKGWKWGTLGTLAHIDGYQQRLCTIPGWWNLDVKVQA